MLRIDLSALPLDRPTRWLAQVLALRDFERSRSAGSIMFVGGAAIWNNVALGRYVPLGDPVPED